MNFNFNSYSYMNVFNIVLIAVLIVVLIAVLIVVLAHIAI